MRVKIENLGPAPFVIQDAFGDLHNLSAGDEVIVTGPVKGRTVDKGARTSYRCTSLESPVRAVFDPNER